MITQAMLITLLLSTDYEKIIFGKDISHVGGRTNIAVQPFSKALLYSMKNLVVGQTLQFSRSPRLYCFFVFFFKITLIADGPLITILPVVTKDLPISPRFTPCNFYRDASSALLQLVNQWLNFTYSRSHAFRYERKNTNSA